MVTLQELNDANRQATLLDNGQQIGRITQGYGPTAFAQQTGYYDRIAGNAPGNNPSLDIVYNDPNIKAFVPGTVISVGENGGWGGQVKIQGDDGRIYQYSHLRNFNVQPQQRIEAGTVLGLMGGGASDPMRGTSTGRHLDFAVIDNGKYIDPTPLLTGASTFTKAVSQINQQAPTSQGIPDRQTFIQNFLTNPDFRTQALGQLQQRRTNRPQNVPDRMTFIRQYISDENFRNQFQPFISKIQGNITKGTPTPNTGRIPNTFPQAENRIENYFGDIISVASDNPNAMTIYNYFAPKYGDRLAKKMVVLSNGESGWRSEAYAGGGEDSIGLFQINLNAHNNRIAKYTGTTDRNTNRQWLSDPINNIKIAEEIYNEQGFKPWTFAHEGIQTYAGIRGNGRADLNNLV